MEKKQPTIWEIFKKFVNSQSIDAVITRQDIIKHLEKKGSWYCYTDFHSVSRYDKCEKKDKQWYSYHTLDYNRNLAEKLGFLAKGNKPGVYIVKRHFPAGYTVSQLRKDYDNRQW